MSKPASSASDPGTPRRARYSAVANSPSSTRPTRRATSACCTGSNMRTATSASRRSRSCATLDDHQLDHQPRMPAPQAASTGGSRSTPTTSLALTRTVPATASRSAVTARRSAALAAAIASA